MFYKRYLLGEKNTVVAFEKRDGLGKGTALQSDKNCSTS